MLQDPTPTTMTRPHRRLIEALEQCGLEIVVEASFPPKWVDCYVPMYHVAFEADGPTHSLAKDSSRDTHLMVEYALPVIHLTDEELAQSMDQRCHTLLRAILANAWQDTVVERRLIAKRQGALQNALD